MVEQMNLRVEPMVHVRFEGQSWDIACGILGVNDRSTDRNVRRALARYLDVPLRKLEPYVIERHANGNLTVRPEAVYG